jgi:hypothetical protein
MRRLVTRVTRDRTIKRRDRLRGQFPGLILRAADAPRGVQWPRSSGTRWGHAFFWYAPIWLYT